MDIFNTDIILMKKWLELNTKNINIFDLLDDLKLKNIYIIQDDNIDSLIKFYAEQKNINAKIINDYSKNLSNADCIIISDYRKYYEVYNIHKNKTLTVSIKELITLSYYLNVTIKNIREKCKNNHILLIRLPLMKYEKTNLSNSEKILKTMSFNTELLRSNPEFLQDLYSDIKEYSNEYIKNIFTEIPIVNINGEIKHIDISTKYVNIINGLRYTFNQPEEYSKEINIYGNCFAFGFGTDDKRTIASFLQKKFDNIKINNYGVWGGDYENRILKTNLNEDDIIIILSLETSFPLKEKEEIYNIFFNKLKELNINYEELSYELFNSKDKLWIDATHINHRGYKIIAEHLYKRIKNIAAVKNHKQQKIHDNANNKKIEKNNILSNYDNELNKYIDNIKQYSVSDKYNKIGSIVMNCNPFTYGHQYLIETALKEVDFLYIFVVEEDKSIFPFKDRFKLVTEGTKHLKNIKILPSGKFIISTITFPEYFSKSSIKSIQYDASIDVNIFAEKIAPALNISIRFAGTEPACNVTKEYNNLMKKILPQHNIQFKVIDRINYNNKPISATNVRKLIDKKDINKLKNLVPETTLKYIMDKFF